MKKVSWSMVGVSFLVFIVVGVIASFVGAAVIPKDGFSMTAVFFVGILYLILGGAIGAVIFNIITGVKAKKTMQKASANGVNGSTFYSSKNIVRIDENSGKVAYVSHFNPSQVQMLDVNKISNVKADYIHAALGGTTYVYFQFFYDGKKLRFPTFTADHAVKLDDQHVQVGMSKAEMFCNILKNVSIGQVM